MRADCHFTHACTRRGASAALVSSTYGSPGPCPSARDVDSPTGSASASGCATGIPTTPIRNVRCVRVAFVDDEGANVRLGSRMLQRLGVPSANVTVLRSGTQPALCRPLILCLCARVHGCTCLPDIYTCIYQQIRASPDPLVTYMIFSHIQRLVVHVRACVHMCMAEALYATRVYVRVFVCTCSHLYNVGHCQCAFMPTHVRRACAGLVQVYKLLDCVHVLVL